MYPIIPLFIFPYDHLNHIDKVIKQHCYILIITCIKAHGNYLLMTGSASLNIWQKLESMQETLDKNTSPLTNTFVRQLYITTFSASKKNVKIFRCITSEALFNRYTKPIVVKSRLSFYIYLDFSTLIKCTTGLLSRKSVCKSHLITLSCTYVWISQLIKLSAWCNLTFFSYYCGITGKSI